MDLAAQTRSDARRSSRAHEAILAAATELAGQRGYAGASIEAIAAAARVGKQTIYRWWPNKAALFIEIYGRLVPADVVAADTGSLAGDLHALLARLSGLYTSTAAGPILSGLVADAQADPALAQQLRDTYVAPRRTIVGAILDRAARRGEIAGDHDVAFASDLFSGAVWFRLLLGEPSLDREFADRLVGAMLAGAVGSRGPGRAGV